MEKMTTYQRLKKENAQMKADLHTLITMPDSTEALEVRVKYRVQYDVRSAILYGTPGGAGRGLLDKKIKR